MENKKIIQLYLAVSFLLCTAFTQAQITVKGKVLDETNQGLFGANIIVKGTTTGTASDLDGKFTITLPVGKTTLVIKAIGYTTKEVEAKAGFDLSIQLEEDLIGLSEVVVTALGVSREKKNIGYAVQEIKFGDSGGSYSGGSWSRKRKKNRKKQSNLSTPANAVYTPATSDLSNERYSGFVENEFKHVQNDPQSTFSVDVDNASYSLMRRNLIQGIRPNSESIRIEEMINYFDYNYPSTQKDSVFDFHTEMSDCPWNKKHKLIRVALQANKGDTINLAPNNLVFLIDVSGSMGSYNKIELVKKSLKMLVKNLSAKDKVSIVTYANGVNLLLDSKSLRDKSEILEAIQNLQTGGGTAGSSGIELAYQTAEKNFNKDANNRIILVTDGDFNIGASSTYELEKIISKKRELGIYLSVLGFGMGDYKDDLVETLADKGNGNYAYIDNALEAKKVLVKEMLSNLYTIAKDVKIQIEFNPNFIKKYKLIGYENRMLDTQDFDDDTKDAGEVGIGHSVTAIYEIELNDASKEKELNEALRYQKHMLSKAANSDEIMTLKIRYKQPNSTKSQRVVRYLQSQFVPISQTSTEFRFAIAVAEFGLILRDSKYKKNANTSHVIKLAKNAKGTDSEGYRAEFIKLVESYELIN